MSAYVMQAPDIDRALTRIAFEILEGNKGSQGLAVLGIPTRGVEMGRRLAAKIAATEGIADPSAICGALDITMFRDDLSAHPLRTPQPTAVPAGGIDGKTVILVDDVLYSGRTVRAALDALSEIGRARAVRLAVLVDRGHRELPIRADYVGKNLPTAAKERVTVSLTPIDDHDGVEIA